MIRVFVLVTVLLQRAAVCSDSDAGNPDVEGTNNGTNSTDSVVAAAMSVGIPIAAAAALFVGVPIAVAAFSPPPLNIFPPQGAPQPGAIASGGGVTPSAALQVKLLDVDCTSIIITYQLFIIYACI